MRLWFVPLNVLVAAFCIHGIAQEHRLLGRFYSNEKAPLPVVLASALVSLCTYKLRVCVLVECRAQGGAMKKVSSCLWLV